MAEDLNRASVEDLIKMIKDLQKRLKVAEREILQLKQQSA